MVKKNSVSEQGEHKLEAVLAVLGIFRWLIF